MGTIPATEAEAEHAVPTPPAFATFEHLYRACRDPLYAYVVGMLRDGHAAEEVVAAAFERAWRRRDRVDADRGDVRAWLFGIARNAALDELRRRGRHAEPASADRLDHAPSPTDAVDAAERMTLRAAVAALPIRDRELVALRFWAGLTNREIAVVTGLSESNVGTRLSRTIRDLRSSL